MPADKTAMGTAPAAALQYCESMTSASSFGWYIFPPKDIRLRWDGQSIEVKTEAGWEILSATSLGPQHEAHWDEHAPEHFKGRLPNYLNPFFVPGVVQIWSGLFVSSAKDWSILVRPIANNLGNGLFQPLEGIVETDVFAPCPLFTNLRLIRTDKEITIGKFTPLFQVQPIHRSCYSREAQETKVVGLQEDEASHPLGLSKDDWKGLEHTTRMFDPHGSTVEMGEYKKLVRKRKRSDSVTSDM